MRRGAGAMSTRLVALWFRLRSSYWFVPLLMTLGAIVLAAALASFDHLTAPLAPRRRRRLDSALPKLLTLSYSPWRGSPGAAHQGLPLRRGDRIAKGRECSWSGLKPGLGLASKLVQTRV